MTIRVGLVGLGRMGKPMCRHLLKAGFPLAVFDVQPEVMAEAGALGARPTTGARQVAQESDVILVIVTDDAEVRRVVGELLHGTRQGAVIAVCSSVHPETCRELARTAAGYGVGLVDAPLARGTRGAENGMLTIFFRRRRARCRRMSSSLCYVLRASPPYGTSRRRANHQDVQQPLALGGGRRLL